MSITQNETIRYLGLPTEYTALMPKISERLRFATSIYNVACVEKLSTANIFFCCYIKFTTYSFSLGRLLLLFTHHIMSGHDHNTSKLLS